MSTPLQVAHRYFDAWNQHDGPSVAVLFSGGGTYHDPTLSAPIGENAIAGHVQGLVAMLPDLSFEIISKAELGEGLVAAQWIMHGTNTAPFRGLPPSGRRVALPGSDFIRVEAGQIRSVQGYFDQKELYEQLGLQVVVQPYSAGPFQFGTAYRFSMGKTTRPGAVVITTLELHNAAEGHRLQEVSQQIVKEMAAQPGFLGLTIEGYRNYATTTTAWTDPESAIAMAREGTHREAMGELYKRHGFAIGGTSLVATPVNGTVFVRCPQCGRVNRSQEVVATCRCGGALQPLSWW